MLPVKTDVLVVGAGPTGLALAIALKRAGADATVIERLVQPQHNSRAAVIHAHTLDVLDRIGAAAPLAAAGRQLAKFSIRDGDGALLQLDFAQAPSAHNYMLMLQQDRTEQLLAQVFAAAGGEILRGYTAEAVTVDGGGALVTVAGPDGPRKVQARFVVGADGMQSVVRHSAGIGYQGARNAESFILADVQMTWGLPDDDVMIFFSPDGLMVVAPLPGGEFRIVADLDDAPEQPDGAVIEAILRRRGPQQGQAKVTAIGWSSRFRIHHRLADAYRKGPLFIIGDAAHVHSPAGGQGMNTGIVDAVVLGQLLARVLVAGEPAALLDQYERLRRPAAAEVLRLAGGLTRLATMRQPLTRAVRNLGLRLVGQLPPARRQLLLGLSGLGRAGAAELPPI